MSEDSKVPDAEEPEVIRSLFILNLETEAEDGPRSPKNDRDLEVVNLTETADEPEVTRKPIKPHTPNDA